MVVKAAPVLLQPINVVDGEALSSPVQVALKNPAAMPVVAILSVIGEVVVGAEKPAVEDTDTDTVAASLEMGTEVSTGLTTWPALVFISPALLLQPVNFVVGDAVSSPVHVAVPNVGGLVPGADVPISRVVGADAVGTENPTVEETGTSTTSVGDISVRSDTMVVVNMTVEER